MLWFYTRDQQSLTVETRYDNETGEYVAIVIGATGHPMTQRFSSAPDFRAWLVNLEQDLTAQNWKADGTPHVLSDGWPDKKPLR